MLKELIDNKNITMYRIAKDGGIPYTTLSELARNKTSFEKSSVTTIYKISLMLGVTIDELCFSYFYKRQDFETYKSNIRHLVKDYGQVNFIYNTIQNNRIRSFWINNYYEEAFYLLGVIDYLSRLNNIPLFDEYDDIRKEKLDYKLYPKDLVLYSKIQHKDIEDMNINFIPELLKYNIYESEIENVY